jgi:polyphosphate kinase
MACTRAAHETGDDRGIVPEHPAIETTLLLEGSAPDPSDDHTPAEPPTEIDAGSDLAVASESETDPSETDPDDTLPAILEAHPNRWYVPDSQRYAFAVRTPTGDRAYRETADAAAALVERYWADSGTDER